MADATTVSNGVTVSRTMGVLDSASGARVMCGPFPRTATRKRVPRLQKTWPPRPHPPSVTRSSWRRLALRDRPTAHRSELSCGFILKTIQSGCGEPLIGGRMPFAIGRVTGQCARHSRSEPGVALLTLEAAVRVSGGTRRRREGSDCAWMGLAFGDAPDVGSSRGIA